MSTRAYDLRIALFGLGSLGLALTARIQPQPLRSWLAGLALGLGASALLHGLARRATLRQGR